MRLARQQLRRTVSRGFVEQACFLGLTYNFCGRMLNGQR
jgi:hypothetical protein